MALPTPVPGLVIRYAFLWREEAARRREEASKDRPCAIILVTEKESSSRDETADVIVTLLPITHTPPKDPKFAVEIPSATKLRLGLDDARSWIVVTDANQFIWPGPDLRFEIANDATSCSHGLLPRSVFNEVRDKFVAAAKAQRSRVVRRTR